MPREIKLNGGEITILKTLGFSGSALPGKIFLERLEEMATAEVLETVDDLVSIGYVLSTRVNMRTVEDIERASLRVNPANARDLKEAINPNKGRDERRARRDRRG